MSFSLEVFFGIGAAALLAVLAWGMVQYKTRNRANDRVTEKAADALFDDPRAYERKRPDFKDQVRPS